MLLFPSSFRSCRVGKRTCPNASAVPYLAYPRCESLLEVLQAVPQRIQLRADVLGRVWCDLPAREGCWFLLHRKYDPALQPFSLVRTPGYGGSALESTGPIDPSRNVLEGHKEKPRGSRWASASSQCTSWNEASTPAADTFTSVALLSLGCCIAYNAVRCIRSRTVQVAPREPILRPRQRTLTPRDSASNPLEKEYAIVNPEVIAGPGISAKKKLRLEQFLS